jgi:hypothetical protein
MEKQCPAICVFALGMVLLVFSGCRSKDSPSLSDLKMSDPNAERQLISGFYKLEQNQWRWTAGRFAVVLQPPRGAGQNGGTLRLQLFVPPGQIEKLGPLTLTAYADDVTLAPEIFTKAGAYSYSRNVPAAAFHPNLLPVVFNFDKALAPSSTETRELAAVVTEVSLDPAR